jgi:hypothetical protein
VPTVPLAVVPPVITGAALIIVNTRAAVPVPVLLLALRLTFDVPAAVGVPEITPVVALTVRPAGKPDAPKLVGELEAVIWYEKGVPTVPLALGLLVITGGATVLFVVAEAVLE